METTEKTRKVESQRPFQSRHIPAKCGAALFCKVFNGSAQKDYIFHLERFPAAQERTALKPLWGRQGLRARGTHAGLDLPLHPSAAPCHSPWFATHPRDSRGGSGVRRRKTPEKTCLLRSGHVRRWGAMEQCGRPPPPRTLLWVKIRTDARLGIVNLLPLSLDKNMT